MTTEPLTPDWRLVAEAQCKAGAQVHHVSVALALYQEAAHRGDEELMERFETQLRKFVVTGRFDRIRSLHSPCPAA